MTEMAQVGVRTRARALAMAAAGAAAKVTGSSRKRKVENQEIISYIELRNGKNRRSITIAPENSVSVSPPMDTGGQRSFIQKDRCNSLASSDRASASCCSSNGSSDDQRNHKFADLEEESVEVETSMYYSCRERREATPSSQFRAESLSDELDSTVRPMPAANSRRRSTATKMPTESELDEFFKEAEKNIQKRFADKYNYDIEKDEPLEGRYQWVRLKP